MSLVATIQADGCDVFYRHMGLENSTAPAIVLVHGFYTSSHMFRNLIPLLAVLGFRVFAPDLAGFGFTGVPAERNYVYTFDNIAITFQKWLEALNITKAVFYTFDYGGPVVHRYALANPAGVAGLVTQNSNAYEEGFVEESWALIKNYWVNNTVEARAALLPFFTFDANKLQYTAGEPLNGTLIQPEAYFLDQFLVERGNNIAIQQDLLFDYQNNVKLYPAIQQYFAERQPPMLVLWGKNDIFFNEVGANKYKESIPDANVTILQDAGHFALETREQLYADGIAQFMREKVVF